MFKDLTDATLSLINKANAGGLGKVTISQGTNLNAIDLRGPALQLYPVITPLRNKLPRETSTVGGLSTQWKAVTGVNTTNLSMGVAAGKRGAEIQITEQDFLATYCGIGLEASVDFEADYSGGDTFNNRATAAVSLLRSVMIGEEAMILGGNASMALGVCPTPSVALAAGGAITVQAGNLVFCVALTPQGLLNAGGALQPVLAGTSVKGVIARTNIDGTSTNVNGGSSSLSVASAPITTTGGNQTINATVAAVKGAAGYAWFLGTAAGNANLAAITTVNAVSLVANGVGTQVASAIVADTSANGLEFDGLITQALKNSAGFFKSLDNTALTADGANGIVEIDVALQFFWDVRRLSPNELWVNSQEALNINKKIVANGGAPLFRFTQAVGTDPQLMGGASIAKYWNKFTQQFIDIIIHPNLVPGTMLFKTNEIPYPLSGVQTVNLIRCRRDYYQIEWPWVSRQYVYGVYADEVLVCRAPFSLGVIANIKNG